VFLLHFIIIIIRKVLIRPTLKQDAAGSLLHRVSEKKHPL